MRESQQITHLLAEGNGKRRQEEEDRRQKSEEHRTSNAKQRTPNGEISNALDKLLFSI